MVFTAILGGYNMFVRLKEDLEMSNNHFGYSSSGGTAKAGTIFQVLSVPRPEKKKYKLQPVEAKFLYYLYLRENDFLRLFEKVNMGVYSSLVEEGSLENFQAVSSRAWVQILLPPPYAPVQSNGQGIGFLPRESGFDSQYRCHFFIYRLVFNMTTQSEMKQLRERINLIRIPYEEKIIRYATDRETVENLLYDLFSEVYVLVQRTAGVEVAKIIDVDWNNILYHRDGKVLTNRLDNHYREYEASEKDILAKLKLKNSLIKISKTEVRYITNTAMYYAIRDKAKFLVVHGEETGLDCDCWENWGTFSPDEFDPTTMLPPFHTDCECSFYVIIKEEDE